MSIMPEEFPKASAEELKIREAYVTAKKAWRDDPTGNTPLPLFGANAYRSEFRILNNIQPPAAVDDKRTTVHVSLAEFYELSDWRDEEPM